MKHLRAVSGVLVALAVVGFGVGMGTSQPAYALNPCGSGMECYSVPSGCGVGVGCMRVFCDWEQCPGIDDPPFFYCFYCDYPT